MDNWIKNVSDRMSEEWQDGMESNNSGGMSGGRRGNYDMMSGEMPEEM